MSRKIMLSVIAILVFPVAMVLAAEEPENIEGKITKSIAVLQSNATYMGANGKKLAMEFLAANPAAAAGPMVTAIEASKDPDARLWLLLTFDGFKDVTVLEPVSAKFIALLNGPAFSTQYWSIKLLGRMKAKDAVKPLIGLLASKDYVIRRESAVSLGQIHDTSAGDAVVLLLKDEEPSVRIAAAGTIAALELAGAKAKLIEAIKVKNEKVHVVKSIIETLEKVTGTSFDIAKEAWAGESSAWQAKIAEWLKKNS